MQIHTVHAPGDLRAFAKRIRSCSALSKPAFVALLSVMESDKDQYVDISLSLIFLELC